MPESEKKKMSRRLAVRGSAEAREMLTPGECKERFVQVQRVIEILMCKLMYPNVRVLTLADTPRDEVRAAICHPVAFHGKWYAGFPASQRMAACDQETLMFIYEVDGISEEFIRLVYRTFMRASQLDPGRCDLVATYQRKA